ncbi:ABC transporter ATP-binding protein [Kurthia huakuii]|uniref:ABC transporter ATP-binding protein n=1 Tax=Kurthia huakuii TaxID=1421019 RepID=UPI000497B949|nr:ABC transporter ATP-binding protein [Kurthia huakuii]MBM7700601.1 acetoin utilization transport system ATP-binding protein [Kurthia huakuii]
MITLQHVSHTFRIGKKDNEQLIDVLKDVSLQIDAAEIVSIVGKSGSGKSTLLNTIAGFLKPVSGSIHIQNTDLTTLNERSLAAFRLQHLGFIFQNFQLMPSLTTYENIELPLKIAGVEPRKRQQLIQQLLKRLDIAHVKDHYPNELSGGQQQRVSIGRALVGNPPIILADEPTGSLDSETEREILTLIQQLNAELGITFVIITHDDEVARIANRIYTMHDGDLKEATNDAL